MPLPILDEKRLEKNDTDLIFGFRSSKNVLPGTVLLINGFPQSQHKFKGQTTPKFNVLTIISRLIVHSLRVCQF